MPERLGKWHALGGGDPPAAEVRCQQIAEERLRGSTESEQFSPNFFKGPGPLQSAGRLSGVNLTARSG